MNDSGSDLERTLGEMLNARAGDIDTLPPRLIEASGEPRRPEVTSVIELDAHRRTTRRWVPLAAAAAVVALIAGVLTSLLSGPGEPGPATHKKPLPPVTRTSCKAQVPPSWSSAVRAASTTLPAAVQWVTAVTTDGGAIVGYGPDTTQRFGYVPAGSHTIRPLVSFSTPHRAHGMSSLAVSVDVDRHTAVFTEEIGGRSARPVRIVLVDLDTGGSTLIARNAPGGSDRLDSEAYIQDGHVYWETKSAAAVAPYRIEDYDIARGTTDTAARNPISLQRSAAGIEWSLQPGNHAMDRPADTPPVVASQINFDTADFFVSDGRAWAWATPRGELAWWSPSARRIVLVPGLLSRPWRQSTPGVPIAVAGPYVQYQVPVTGEDRLIDVRTGANVPFQHSIDGADGTMIGTPFAGGADLDGDLTRVPTATLPELHC